MQPRERVLMAIIVCLLAGIGSWKGYQSYRARLATLDSDILKAQKSLDDALAAKQAFQFGEDEWRKFGRQTLSMDPNAAKNLLRDELFALARDAGLSTQDTVVTLGDPRRWMDHGIQRINASVNTPGEWPKVVSFLYAIASQPYALRVTYTSISPATKKEQVGKLTLNLRLEALILPTTKRVPEIKPAELEPGRREPMKSRLLLASAEEYQKVVTPALFEPWKPPAPEQAKNPSPSDKANDVSKTITLTWAPAQGAKTYRVHFGAGSPGKLEGEQPGTTFHPKNLQDGVTYAWRVDTVNEGGTTTGPIWTFTTHRPQPPKGPAVVQAPPEPVKPVDVPPPDGRLVLSRIVSSPRGQQIVLQEPGNPNADDQRKEVGDEVFGGILVYVHPKGAVSEKDGAWRFHAISQPLQSCVPLTLETMPEVFDALQKLQGRAEGISERPG